MSWAVANTEPHNGRSFDLFPPPLLHGPALFLDAPSSRNRSAPGPLELAAPSSSGGIADVPDTAQVIDLEKRIHIVVQKQHALQQQFRVHRHNEAVVSKGLATLEPLLATALLRRLDLTRHVMITAFGGDSVVGRDAPAGAFSTSSSSSSAFSCVLASCSSSAGVSSATAALLHDSAAIMRIIQSSTLVDRLNMTSAADFASQVNATETFTLLLPLILREVQLHCNFDRVPVMASATAKTAQNIKKATSKEQAQEVDFLLRWSSFLTIGCESFPLAFRAPARRPHLRGVVVDLEEACDRLAESASISASNLGERRDEIPTSVVADRLRHVISALRDAAQMN